MALTTITFDPTAITDNTGSLIPRVRTITASGNESFTGGTLSEPNGASGWLSFPATCDHAVPFNVSLSFRETRPTGVPLTTTLRVTSAAVTADIVIAVSPAPGPRPLMRGRR